MSGCGGCQEASPLRRRLSCGGCSWVEYQQIAAVVLSCPSLVRTPGGSGTVGVVMWWFSCLAHCWVLRQQGRGFAVFAFLGCGWCSGGFVCFWFPCHDGLRTCLCVGCVVWGCCLRTT